MEFLVILVFLLLAALILIFDLALPGDARLSPGSTITGTADVTDGDGIRVSGYDIRLTGLDAPEWDQLAKHQHGYWFNHGKSVKIALTQAIGGKHVQVAVEGQDKYGRLLGTVICDGKDVGAWLVRNGYAISAYGDKYKGLAREARLARRGLWGHAEVSDPRAWRRRNAANN